MENSGNNFPFKNKLRTKSSSPEFCTQLQEYRSAFSARKSISRYLTSNVLPIGCCRKSVAFSKAPPTTDRNNFSVRSRLLIFSANTEKALQKCLETLNDSPLFCGAVSSAKTTDRRQEFVNPGTCRFDFAVTQSVFKKPPRFFRL